ncbi:hypothetical protein [Elizabethkingia meningoseptica]|uniref:hypothetical protein n=1 Tax=Elizabethkingia meningoseptica TaxID=238 RepID=UPI0020135078|nr:hypothetical protein [Elizabethkingia meningoseptica]MCL1674712.1 hypothetical protein [Elizabethkingia meningoseptica]MCL1685920.1 hypothetical protein [Elizabethkingia meningoseptica]
MKSVVSIFIIFTIALRPVLPLIDYMVNYDYIANKLCENRNKPFENCFGKCYLTKELVKASESGPKQDNLKTGLAGFIDSFIIHESFSFKTLLNMSLKKTKLNSFYASFYNFALHPRIFHPPLISLSQK